MHSREDQGDPTKEPMEVEQPGRARGPTQGAGREGQAPDHRGGGQRPRHDARRPSRVPRDLAGHPAAASGPRPASSSGGGAVPAKRSKPALG